MKEIPAHPLECLAPPGTFFLEPCPEYRFPIQHKPSGRIALPVARSYLVPTEILEGPGLALQNNRISFFTGPV